MTIQFDEKEAARLKKLSGEIERIEFELKKLNKERSELLTEAIKAMGAEPATVERIEWSPDWSEVLLYFKTQE